MATTVTVVYNEQNQNRINYLENKAQAYALAAGGFIFMSGGLNIALGLGWSYNTYIFYTLQFQFCWFIGFIVGAIVSAPLITLLRTKTNFLISSFLVIVSGVVFTSVPYNTIAIITVRYINGFAVGFATVPFIVYTSETSQKSERGAFLAVEQVAITLGIAIQVIFDSQWTNDVGFPVNRLHGIFSLIFGLMSLGACFRIIESPIFCIRNCNDAEALECQRYLGGQAQQVISHEIQLQLEEHKNYVIQNENFSGLESFMEGLEPLVKVLLYRSMVAFTFSLPLSLLIANADLFSTGDETNWTPMVFAILRFVGALLSLWALGRFGRKLVPLLALGITGALTIAIGACFYGDYDEMKAAVVLLLLMQFSSGIFVPSTSAYLGEAFPMLAKPYFIACCVIVEQAIHIIVICSFIFLSYYLYVYLISVGVIICVLFLIFCAVMPETKNTSLKEAQDRFKQTLHFNFK